MIKNPIAFHSGTQEQVSLLNQPSPETNLFPPSQEHMDEEQIAWMAKGGQELGLLLGRIFSVDRSNRLGTAYQKLKELELKKNLQDMRDKGAPDPLETAVESLTPVAPSKRGGEAVPEGGDPLDVAKFKQGIYGWGDGELGVVSRVSADAVADDEYLKHITFGDADMDRIFAEYAANDPNLVDGMIAGIRVVGKGGDDKVPDEGHVRSLLQSMGSQIKKQLAGKSPEQIRTMTLQQLDDMANLLGMNPETLKLNFMGGLKIDLSKPGDMAAQMIAGKNLLMSELKVLDKLTDEALNARTGSFEKDAARIAWRQQAELVAQLQAAFKGTQTEIARTLSGLRVTNKTDANVLKRDVEGLLGDAGGVGQLDDVIDAYSKGLDAGKRLELADKLTNPATWRDAIHEVWLNSILSGYWSHVKNVAGGVAMLLGDDFETFTAAGVQVFTRTARGMERDVTFGDVQAKVFGQLMSLREAFMASGKAAWTREEPGMLGGGSKLDVRGGYAGGQGRPDAFSAAGLGMKAGTYKAKAVNFLGSILTLGRAPLRMLQAEDALFKVVNYRGTLYEEAYRSGRALGLKGDDFSTHIADNVFNPPETTIMKAQDTAKMNTLQSDMEGNWANAQKMLRGWGLRWLVPFFKTPTNALLYVAERSPVARWTNRYSAAKETGGAEWAKAQTRWQLGTIAMGVIAMEWMQGNVTGGISSDSRVREAYKRQGIKPYSIRIGDSYYSYNVVEPVSSMIGIVADAAEVWNHPDTDERDALELVTGVIGAIGYNLTNKTFTTALSQFMEAVRDPHRRMGRVVDQYVGSILPGSAALNEIRKVTDDLKRFKIEVIDPMKAKIPGFSEDLGLRRDLWGRPIPEYRFRSPYQPNKIDKVIMDLRLPIAEHDKNYGLPGSYPNVDDVEYTVPERDFFLKTAGELSKQYIEKEMQKASVKRHYKAALEGNPESREDVKMIINDNLKKARKDAFTLLKRHKTLGRGFVERLQERDQGVFREKIKSRENLIRANTP